MAKHNQRGENTRKRIVQSALYCLAHYGERETTFQKIADHCGVSQPLVVHYFKARENIFRYVVDDFLQRARKKTEEALNRDLSPTKKLGDYFRVSLELFREEPEWARLYVMLHYFAGFTPEYRAINSEIKRVAVARLAGILREGIAAGEFAVENAELTAKLIHMNAAGLVLGVLTENPTYPDNVLLKILEDFTLRYVLIPAGP